MKSQNTWGAVERGRHAGVLVPLFSIPSSRSWGIGELGDIVPLAAWLRRARLDTLQLLPLNEMAPGQHSPYSAITAMAIDPVFISLEELEDFLRVGGEAALDEAARAALARVRAGRSVDYGMIRELKSRALRLAFRQFDEVEWRCSTARGRALRAYREQQAWWLDDYALFRALHAHFGGRPWISWPPDLRSRDPRALGRARRMQSKEILFYQYVQWALDGQWRQARRRAAPVAVMGDMPFVVGRDSADVWAHQDVFDLEVSVGAPPDAFSEQGQDWGLPAYRWEALRQQDYRWLRQRARRSADLYDGYRVDHVVGFYRTYVVPLDGRPPAFLPAEEPEQLMLGEEVLRILAGEGARVVAEDLGTVPNFVRASLARLGVPGCRVLRWEREWTVAGRPFRDPASYPPTSVAMSGTHDTVSMADWWDAMPPEDRAHAWRIPALRAMPERSLHAGYTDELRDALLWALFASGSGLVILPVQDVFGWRDQINVPGTFRHSNWTYRLPWPSDRLDAEPAAVERAETLRAWSERSGRALATAGA